MRIDDGGPAYPVEGQKIMPNGEWSREPYTYGMSLRDYFAAAVLNQMYAYEMKIFAPERIRSLMEGREPQPDDDKHWSDLVARDAYAVADAMIAERDKLKEVVEGASTE